MSKPLPGSPGEPSGFGCRMQMLLLVAFFLLFVTACWLIGKIVAT